MDGDSTNSSSVCLAPNMLCPKPVFAVNWRRRAQQLRKEAHVFYFVFKHPRTRWYARLLAACSVGYLFSPIQLIPNFVPVIGFLDDFFLLLVGGKLLRQITPPDVLTECRDLADACEIRRKEKIRSVAAIVTSVAIVTAWLLAAVTVTALTAAHYISQAITTN